MRERKISYWVADTETTVPRPTLYEDANMGVEDSGSLDLATEWEPMFQETVEGVPETFVWAAAIAPVKLDPCDDDCTIFTSSSVHSAAHFFLLHCAKLPDNPIVYFHNLAFDGMFLIDTLIREGYKYTNDKKLKNGEFSALISDTGIWYNITVKLKRTNKYIEFRDSLKIIPSKVERIAKDLKTKYRKLVGSIDYTKERLMGYNPDGSERVYIRNDVLVMSEALAKISEHGLLKYLTIGSAALHDFIARIGGKKIFRSPGLCPVLDIELDSKLRKAYRGGWCHNMTCNDIIKPNRIYRNIFGDMIRMTSHGHTYDVNSLYPSKMRGHRYPCGEPREFTAIEFNAHKAHEYIIEVDLIAKLKPRCVPFLQITTAFHQHEYISETDGIMRFTFTKPEWELVQETHDIDYCNIIQGWAFDSIDDLFDDYVDHWYEVKANSSDNPTMRLISKLFLNSLYGKMITNPIKRSARIEPNEDGTFGFVAYEEQTDPVYTPIGAYITAYARAETIRAANANYDTFMYSDTDSIHLGDEAVGIKVDSKELGAWKHEGAWDMARFVRQKTYIERIVEDGGKPVEPHLDIKACGAPEAVKERLLYKVTERDADGKYHYYRLERDENDKPTNELRSHDEVLERFTYGLKEVGKLMRKRVPGGVILYESEFSINE